jgi:hypothetical protein
VKRLTAEQIERLKSVQRHGDGRRSYSIYNLREALAAPFTWETLRRAIEGKPIQERNRDFIVQWLDRYVPASAAPRAGMDAKSRAAGERDEEPVEVQEETSEVAKPGLEAGRLRDERIPREK